MNNKKTGPVIILISFVVLLYLSWIIWFLFRAFLDTENYENRNLSEKPAFSLSAYSTFPREYDAYLNDNIPFRSSLISLNSAVDFHLFNTSSSPDVIKGKEDWLFYSKVSDGDPISCYMGTNLFTEEELKAIADNLLRQRDIIAENGGEFVLNIIPNKEHIYSEYMPDSFGPPAEIYGARQLVDYLINNTDLRVVYPYEELMAAKSATEYDIYHKTDTHWNEIGAYVGSKALLKELGVEMPELSDLKITQTADRNGDLAGILNLSAQMRHLSHIYTIEGYDTHGLNIVGEDWLDSFEYTAENADPRRIFAVKDSFFTLMRHPMGSQFAESCFTVFTAYNYEKYMEYNPDIFVYEITERHLRRLMSFSVK